MAKLNAYQQGKAARMQGASLDSCPPLFGYGTSDWMAWRTGWREIDSAGYGKPSAPFVDVCQETAYGATTRLSFQIRVF